jgi:hypothetical protein
VVERATVEELREPDAFVPYDFKHLAERDDSQQQQRVRQFLDVAKKLAERRQEALRLYEPLPLQDRYHASAVRTRLLRGSNRGGKSLPAAIETARAVTGQDPYGKWPDKGTFFIIGDDYDHFGTVIYPMLFERGAFKIIRDTATGMWRSWRPWDAADQDRKAEAREAPPLIPRRFVRAVSWHLKKDKIPSSVELTTGWKIHFFSSKGEPPQGMGVDGVWLDEEVRNPAWFPEMSARVVTRSGRITWSAAPQNGTDVFFDLCDKADTQAHLDGRTIDHFYIRLADNPHIGEADKVAMADSMSAEDRAIRVEGEFSLSAQRIYHEFSRVLHSVEPFDVPRNWSRFAIIDPGHQVCAFLLAAVPDPADVDPSEYDLLLYKEGYVRACSASKFGRAFCDAVGADYFEDFTIDDHGSRVTEAGSGRTIYDQYAEALKALGVKSARTGHRFSLGSDNRQAGIERVKSYLEPRPGGRPRLRVFKTLWNFHWEMERYRFKRIGGQVTDQPDEDNKPTHLMACLRYLAMSNPRFVPAPLRQPPLDPVIAAFFKRRRKAGGGLFHNFGPAGRGSVA